MLSTFWMTAPAGVDGRGSLAVRPSLLAAVRGAEGTGLPVAGIAPRLRGQATGGFGARRGAVRGLAVGGTALLMTSQHDQIAQNDGTTLGFHPSRRPWS